MGGFNPCFLGTCPQSVSRYLDATHTACFNPCFLGTCPQSRGSCIFLFSEVEFQSLFSWNLPSEPKEQPLPGQTILVSILVFLELALRAASRSGAGLWQKSFNPCFLGTCPQSTVLVRACRRPPGFNPCFLGTCPQSLSRSQYTFPACTVSILVFLELALRVPTLTIEPLSRSVSILVFLELALRGYEHTPTYCKAYSFNPCFLGTCPQSLYVSYVGPYGLKFQSLFSWNLPSEANKWICGTDPITVFQSLFSWNLPSEPDHSQSKGHRLRVSILVFLELALRDRCTHFYLSEYRGFNPCFLGTCPQRVLDGALVLDAGGFQSLFSWNLPSEPRKPPMWPHPKQFQSLFSWNLPSESANAFGPILTILVSILVFLELALRV